MINRVDVLTGGASSVYGADAVAGVVNFIMDTDFEGLRIDSQYSFYQHTNHASNFVTDELNRLNYVKVGGKILDSTNAKLTHYVAYASERLNTEVTVGDCLDHGLRLLYDRDAGFKEYLKMNQIRL